MADEPARVPEVPDAEIPAVTGVTGGAPAGEQTYTYKTTVRIRLTPMRIAVALAVVAGVSLLLLTLLVYALRS